MGQYNILVIPENHLESKRFHLPKLAVHFAITALALLIIFTTVMTWGFVYYRQLAKKNVASLSNSDEIYRSQVNSKISALEETIKRTQQFTTRLESMVGVESGKMKIGVGPLSERDDFGKYLEKISRLPKPTDSAFFSDSSDLAKPQNLYARLNLKIDELSENALALESKVNEVYELSQDKLSYWASTPSIWPVQGWVTSDFGFRNAPFRGASTFHEGLDIAAPYGSPIYAPADGRISFSGRKGGYGNALVLDHGYGVATLFGHTSNVFVQEGEKVRRGQVIAAVGSTGASSGPHLHYEVHVDGVPTDPMKFLLK